MFKQKKISVPIGSMGLHLEVLFCFFYRVRPAVGWVLQLSIY
jgi:hypothetical protein